MCAGFGDVATPNADTQLHLCGDQIKTEEQGEHEQSNEDVFIAFARVFSGTIKKGQELYVLGPKHDPRSALEKVRVEHNIVCIPLVASQEYTIVF
jgi:translation elongation factor EF-G